MSENEKVKSGAKKERTIRSETTKVFLVIFCILTVLGTFTVFSTFKGANTFSKIKDVYLQQFMGVESMKQKALDIISIYYALSADQDLEILMTQLKRFDGLIAVFEESHKKLGESVKDYPGDPNEKAKMAELIDKSKKVFDSLNNNCRLMTFAMMEGKKKEAQEIFPKVDAEIQVFKAQLDELESIVNKRLESEAKGAQSLLRNVTVMGVLGTLFAILVTVGLIYYLMRFLSISLLPISNLMHNMTQAVFSIDKKNTIISPVSRYSSTVFSEEIVGKNIFDVIYRDLDHAGEVFAKAKSGLMSSFGEDDLQWMLAEDNLPRQVSRTYKSKDGGEDFEKILKLTYTPLWNKENLLQNVMIVAEDVTEIEKLRQEAIKQQGEISIIQGLMGINREDLKVFLDDSDKKIRECYTFLETLDSSVESRQVMFRHLHTIKGNARLNKLNLISEVVHVTENVIVDINKCLDNGEKLPDGSLVQLDQGLKNIEISLATHNRMAQKMFGIANKFDRNKEEHLSQCISNIEIATATNGNYENGSGRAAVAKKFVKLSSVFGEVQKTISSAIEKSKFFGAEELCKSLTQTHDYIRKGVEIPRSELIDIGRHYNKFMISGQRTAPYTTDPSVWITVFHKVLDLTLSYEKSLMPVNRNADFDSLETDLMNLIEVADSHHFLFMRQQLAKIVIGLLNGNLDNASSMRAILESLWQYMTLIFAVDSTFATDDAVKGEMGRRFLDSDLNMVTLDRITDKKVLFLSFVRSLLRKNYSLNNFWDVSIKYLKLGTRQEFIEMVLGSSDARSQVIEFYEFINAANDNPIQSSDVCQLIAKYKMKALISIFEHNEDLLGQLRLDVVQMLAPYVDPDAAESLENEQQSIQVPLKHIQEIKNQMGVIGSKDSPFNFETLKKLQETVSRAFDLPLKSIFRKMDPMVKDLAGRLEKQAELKIIGEDVSVERDFAYLMRDAFVHMIRNSMDHGIETPEERTSVGKAPHASIEIGCHEGKDYLEFLVKDDGRGIDTERVCKKAVEIGKISAEVARGMSSEDKLNLIFIPKLSTKDEVSTLSGRGVGMDAVKDIVTQLGGRISIVSTLGKGTEFRIVIPKKVQPSLQLVSHG